MGKLLLLFSIMLMACYYLPNIIYAAYPPNFYHNDKQCLYAYMNDGEYHISFHESESQKGILAKPEYLTSSRCTDKENPGLLDVNFNTNDNYMNSMSISFQIQNFSDSGYWVINKATLKIKPSNPGLFPSETIELNPVDIYAGDRFSYSCSSLVLQNLQPTKDGPHFKITLRRFQVQPFKELAQVIFAPSYDCSVWLTLPVIMGMLLILFIVFTVMIGVYFLIQQGNQGGDLKFSKQGGMLMNQAQLDATKGL